MTRKYRINKDWAVYTCWSVEVWRIWWPFWVEERGMLESRQAAEELLELLENS
jgi:hypothetical protein